jgi:3-hydroxybutyryl-CoA dehydratase
MNDSLPEIDFTITQENINLYAEASGDFNPLHLDEEFAKNTMFKGTIAHGLMTLAFISQAMTRWYLKGWIYGGVLDIAFVSPLRPGDVVSINGKVSEKDEQDQRIFIDLDVTNQKGDRIVVGKTSLSFSQK